MRRALAGILQGAFLGVAASAVLLPALAQEPAGVSSASAPSSERQGFLYEVVAGADSPRGIPPGARLILFGTIHVDRAGASALNAREERELVAARRLALEADPRDMTTLMRVVRQYGYYPSGDSLSQHLSVAELDAVRSAAAAYGQSPENIERLKPWFIANNLAALELMHLGLSPEGGSEGALARIAQEHAIAIVQIEGFDAQMAIFDKETDDLQHAQLDETLSEIKSGALADDARTLVSAWHAGDVATINEELAAMAAQPTPYVRFTLERLIVARDRTMADRAEQYLREGETTFFAVGCLHLFGDAGLVAELARRGYQVRDLQ